MNDGEAGKVGIKRGRKESTKERRKRRGEEKVIRRIKKIQENKGWKYINRITKRKKKERRG